MRVSCLSQVFSSVLKPPPCPFLRRAPGLLLWSFRIFLWLFPAGLLSLCIRNTALIYLFPNPLLLSRCNSSLVLHPTAPLQIWSLSTLAVSLQLPLFDKSACSRTSAATHSLVCNLLGDSIFSSFWESNSGIAVVYLECRHLHPHALQCITTTPSSSKFQMKTWNQQFIDAGWSLIEPLSSTLTLPTPVGGGNSQEPKTVSLWWCGWASPRSLASPWVTLTSSWLFVELREVPRNAWCRQLSVRSQNPYTLWPGWLLSSPYPPPWLMVSTPCRPFLEPSKPVWKVGWL